MTFSSKFKQRFSEPRGKPEPPSEAGDRLVSAREIRLSGQWGQVFGPLDLDIDRGGLTLISAPPGSARTALMMALCGRMKLHRGQLTVLGHTNDQQAVFKESAIACFEELDEPKPSITVQDLITEQIRWESNFFKWVPLATTVELREMCGYLFEGLPLPPIDTFISDLTELEQSLIRVAVANTRRPPLLVVGRLDQIADRREQEELLDRLVDLGESQSVLAAHVNAEEFTDRVKAVIEVPGLYEFEQRKPAVQRSRDELDDPEDLELEADDRDDDANDFPEEPVTEVINPAPKPDRSADE